ncbi:MAG: RES family NAD+ phosphorylase [Veillonella sp.]|jgi:sepS16C protein|nr:RES family NAD+ phosphorylase [Veillonella sp.]
MKICEHCFNDEELKAIIKNNNGTSGICPNCGAETILYKTEDLQDISELFEGFFDSYQIHNAGRTLVEELCKNWSIFNPKLNAEQVLGLTTALCKQYFEEHQDFLSSKIVLKKRLNSDYVANNSVLKDISWDEFQRQLIEVNRYHPNNINTKVLKSLFSYIESYYDVGDISLYRARKSHNKKKLDKRDMGAPPARKSGEGRINAKGVGCLYLATDEDTCMKEIRAGIFETVCVGSFEITKPLRLVNLSKIKMISPFKNPDNGDISNIDINRDFLDDFNNSIRSPQASTDDSLEYISTQYIADYIKSITDEKNNRIYDGIEFASTHSETGRNIVLFETSLEKCKCACTNVNCYYIDSLNYNFLLC